MVPQPGLPPLGRFPQFSAFDEVGNSLTGHWGRKQQKPTKVGLFPFKPLAVALLCLSATVNKTHMVPSSLITSETQRRATAYQWFEELRNAYDSNNVV